MSTVDYINMFVEYFLLLINEIKKFFNGLTGKEEPETTEAPEEHKLPE